MAKSTKKDKPSKVKGNKFVWEEGSLSDIKMPTKKTKKPNQKSK